MAASLPSQLADIEQRARASRDFRTLGAAVGDLVAMLRESAEEAHRESVVAQLDDAQRRINAHAEANAEQLAALAANPLAAVENT